METKRKQERLTQMKGIILAGGTGTRLYPITKVVSKQLTPLYDKPMIYYPLATLIESGIKEILIITTPEDKERFQELLGDGSDYGITVEYKEQAKPEGLAQAFIIGEDFIGNDRVILTLGDNVFSGVNLINKIKKASKNGSTIFGVEVDNPERFGVIEINNNKVISIEEKPKNPKSNIAITGLYIFDNKVIEIAKKIKPSKRNELEITDVINEYLKENKLNVELLNKNDKWFDTGTPESLFEATQYVRNYQIKNNKQIGNIEEKAYLNNNITKEQLKQLAERNLKNHYGKYLLNLIEE